MQTRRIGYALIVTGVIGLVLLLLIVLIIPQASRPGSPAWGGWGWMGPMHEWMHGRGDAPAPPPSPVPGSREIRIATREFAFNPDRIEASRDETVTIVLVNEGRLPHDFTIPATGVSVPVLPGSTTRAGIRVPGEGSWEFYCSIPGHREAGMKGTIEVS